MTGPTISCLMVTRDRPALARRAVDCFAAQDHQPRELVILSDGPEAFEALRDYARDRCGADAVVAHCVPRGSRPLGELRNLSIALARGEVVCQWDDDDLSHPRRLSMQLAHMRREAAQACFMTEQLHLLWRTQSLYWCDWTQARGRPLRSPTIPNTLMCTRQAAPRYPERGPVARRSEDAYVMRALQAQGPVAQLRGAGWLYVYVSHGANTWDESHHLTIVQATGMEAPQLAAREQVLREAMAAFALDAPLVVRDCRGAAVFTLPPRSRAPEGAPRAAERLSTSST